MGGPGKVREPQNSKEAAFCQGLPLLVIGAAERDLSFQPTSSLASCCVLFLFPT